MLINDGQILWENLKVLGYDKNWLEDQLSLAGVNKTKEVFYAEWLEGEGIYVSTIS